jgi:hypothetical protein
VHLPWGRTHARSPSLCALLVSAVVVAAATVVLITWWPVVHAGPRLVLLGSGAGDGIGMDIPWSKDQTFAFGSIPLCTDGPGVIAIRGLKPVGGNGQLAVVEMATRPHVEKPRGIVDVMFGTSHRTLAAEGFPKAPAIVAATCPPDASTPRPNQVPFYEFAARFRRMGSGDGTFAALRVDYISRGRVGHLTLPVALRLCGPGHRTNESCPDPPSSSAG